MDDSIFGDLGGLPGALLADHAGNGHRRPRDSGGMSAARSRKAVAAAPKDDRGLPALLANLRERRTRADGTLTVEAVEKPL